MSASGDTEQLLRPIPLWKRLRPMVAGVAGLRAGVARLKAASALRPKVGICPVCGSGALRVKSVERQPLMGELGPQEFTFQCDRVACSHSETRLHGYRGPAAA